jgi:hypothetical protein
VMAHRVRPGTGITRRMSKASKPALQNGTQFADTIRASGQTSDRTNRPDRRPHPTSRQIINYTLAMREPSTEDIQATTGLRQNRSFPSPSISVSILARKGAGYVAAGRRSRGCNCGLLHTALVDDEQMLSGIAAREH